jgi:hypothetical protein
MRVRRVQNRVVKGKQYDRWLVTIPPPLIEGLGWTDTTELELKRTKKGLRLEPHDPSA